MNFRIVNGTLIRVETQRETRSRPIAMPRSFFSGSVRATILRNDPCAFEGRKRLHIDQPGEFEFACGVGPSSAGLLSETGTD